MDQKMVSLKNDLLKYSEERASDGISLYPSISEKELKKFIASRENLPEEYALFLEHFNGCKKVWGEFNFVGVDNSEEEYKHIKEVIEEAVTFAESVYMVNTNDLEEIRLWEQRTVQYFLPHYFIFGTNLKDKLLFFNKYNHDLEGNREVILWNKHKGVVTSYKNFYELMSHIIFQLM